MVSRRMQPKMKQSEKESSSDKLFKSLIEEEKQKRTQHRKQVSFEMDGKSCVTESTASSSIQSEIPGTHGQQVSSSQLELHNMSKLIRSNRSLHVENMTMKKDMREMKVKMTAMETSLQRTQPQKEKELLNAIEALHKVTTKQGQKIEAYKASKKKLKERIARRDATIGQLRKERDDLKAASAQTRREFLSMHKEVAGLQQELRITLDDAGECKAQLERVKDLNSGLTSRLIDLESQLQTMDIDTDTPTKQIQQIMKQSSHGSRSSILSSDGRQVMDHIAVLEEKIKLTRGEFQG